MHIPQETVDQIRVRHVKQLALFQLELEEFPIEDILWSKDELIHWINENKQAITAARSSCCMSESSDSPNWDAILYTLIESASMYLRDRGLMSAAIRAAQKGDTEEAALHLKNSQKPIEDVARALDCSFVQLCDFSQQSPDGTLFMSGAFCGMFAHSDADGKVFSGVAFKGSNSGREVLSDLDWKPLETEGQIAFGARTHTGFYRGLFTGFTTAGVTHIPFDFMVAQLQQVYKDNSLLHFTGHSLGAAYATLAFGEFLRRQTLQSSFTFGDAYLFGSPRTCQEPFAREVALRTTPASKRSILRIVNNDDPITTIPPPLEAQLVNYPYIHVDGGWEIFPDESPKKMASEQPDNPVPPLPWAEFWDMLQHRPQAYYESWKNTPHT